MANYKTFSPILTTQTRLDDGEVSIKEGQLIVTRDGGGIYYDTSTERVLVSKDDTKLPLDGTAVKAKAVDTWTVLNGSGTFYPLFSNTSTGEIKQLKNACSFYEGSNTSTLLLGNSTATTSSTGRIGQIQLYGNSSGSTQIIPTVSSNSNLLLLPSTSGTLALTEDVAAAYLPLTGGTLSGNLMSGTSTSTAQSQVGVSSTVGSLYLFSNPSGGTRGIWDGKIGNYLIYSDSSMNVHYTGGRVHDNWWVENNISNGGSLNVAGTSLLQGGTQNQTGIVGTTGTSGYVLFMQIQVTGTYSNKPITFNVHRRGFPVCRVELRFKNTQNATDHTVEEFVEKNMWGDSWIYMTQSSGVVKLYAWKTEGYDTISVSDLSYDFNYDKFAITYPGTLVTSEISGWTQATCWQKANIPTIYYGTSVPTSSTGKNGDIYVVYS